MANPIAYVNVTPTTIFVGNAIIPAYQVFAYDPDDGGVYYAPNMKQYGTATQSQIDSQVSLGRLEKAFTSSNGLSSGFRTGKRASGGLEWNFDERWVVEFKMQRAATVYRGTTKIGVLPAQANILVTGGSIVGKTYKQRLAIVGFKLSEYQATQFANSGYKPTYFKEVYAQTGKYPSGYIFDYNDGQLWIDTGMGTSGYDKKSTVAPSGLGIGNLIGII